MATIGQRIRNARIRAGWTQTAFAEEVGCSRAQLKNIEGYDETPAKGSVYFQRVLTLLGIDPDAPDLGDDIDPDNPPVTRATRLQLLNELVRREMTHSEHPAQPDQVIQVTLPRTATNGGEVDEG